MSAHIIADQIKTAHGPDVIRALNEYYWAAEWHWEDVQYFLFSGEGTPLCTQSVADQAAELILGGRRPGD